MTQEQLKKATQLFEDIKETEKIVGEFESMHEQERNAGRVNSAALYKRLAIATDNHLSDLQDKFKTL